MPSAERQLSPSRTPGRIGRYIIYEELARGGMAQVFVARKEGARDICVLKQLLVELKGHETAAKRFYREAHVASYLVHPNICRITDAGFEGDTFCIAMEFIPGKDVEAMMRTLVMRGRLIPYQVTFAVILTVLDALAYAHDHTDPHGEKLDLVHRDLSPRNMMLSFHGDVKVIDFGLVRGKIDDFKTQAGMLLGTPRYLSPEQAVASPVDRRSDLYTVSAVLHEMLTGRLLVPDGERIEVLKAVVGQPAPLVTSLNPGLPKALDAVIAKGLAKKKEDRWQTAGEYRQALVAAAGSLAEVKREALGAFLRDLYPEDVKRSAELQERGRSDFARSQSVRSSEEEAEPQEWTHTGLVRPEDLAGLDDTGSRTRTGFIEPSDLGAGDQHGATRTAMVDGSGKTAVVSGRTKLIERDAPPDADQFTRTAELGEQPMTRVTEQLQARPSGPPRSNPPRPASMPAAPFTGPFTPSSIPPSASLGGQGDAGLTVQQGVSRSTIIAVGAMVFLAFVLGVLGTIFIMSRPSEVATAPAEVIEAPPPAPEGVSAAPAPRPAAPEAVPAPVAEAAPPPEPAPAAAKAKPAGGTPRRVEKPEAEKEPALPAIKPPPQKVTARAESLLAQIRAKGEADPEKLGLLVVELKAAAARVADEGARGKILGKIGAAERDDDVEGLAQALQALNKALP